MTWTVSSDSALELVDELQSLPSHVVGESWIDDALDSSSLHIPCRLRLEIEDGLGRTQDGACLRMLGERLRHRGGLGQKRGCSTAGPPRSQFGEDLACLSRLPDEVEFVWVQEMKDEAGVFLHDVVPELGHFLPVQFRLAAAELLESPGPSLGLMAGVIEEQRPHQAPKSSVALGVSQGCLVLDERLHRFDHLAGETLQVALVWRSRSIDPSVEFGEGLRELERLLPFVLCDLRRHQQRKEDAVLGHDVRGEPSVGPGVARGVLIILVGQNDGFLERFFRSPVSAASVDLHLGGYWDLNPPLNRGWSG